MEIDIRMKFSVRIMTAFLRLLGRQPLKVHYMWSGFFSWLMKDVLRYRRDVVMINLARSFPDRKYKEIAEIADKSYLHLSDIFTEAIWFSRAFDHDRLRKQHIMEVTNPEYLTDLINNSKSVVMLSSHRGNWEIAGGLRQYFYDAEVPFEEKDSTVVYKTLKSRFWDQVMAVNRCAAMKDHEANCYVESGKIIYYIYRNKDKKKVYIFPTDQYPYANSGIHHVNEFMHQKTKSMTGGAAIAHKLGFSVVYLCIDMEERGKYKVTFKEVCKDASELSPEEIMNRYYEMLQLDIDREPWNYLWTHKRWK